MENNNNILKTKALELLKENPSIKGDEIFDILVKEYPSEMSNGYFNFIRGKE